MIPCGEKKATWWTNATARVLVLMLGADIRNWVTHNIGSTPPSSEYWGAGLTCSSFSPSPDSSSPSSACRTWQGAHVQSVHNMDGVGAYFIIYIYIHHLSPNIYTWCSSPPPSMGKPKPVNCDHSAAFFVLCLLIFCLLFVLLVFFHPRDYWCILQVASYIIDYTCIYYVITWITMCRSGRTNHLPGPCSLPPQLQWDATPAWPRSLECPFQSPPGSWFSSHFHMKSGKCSTFGWKNVEKPIHAWM